MSFLTEKFPERGALADMTQACNYNTMAPTEELEPSDILRGFELVRNTVIRRPFRTELLLPKLPVFRLSKERTIVTATLPETTIDSYNYTYYHGDEAYLRLYKGLAYTDVVTAGDPASGLPLLILDLRIPFVTMVDVVVLP
ncbi:hypothetical protein EYZ11_005397 [Aspergillus tanneri]|uniref:Uncharacterized protein n=1 Tax=Aspergillus tanneri TaxID=1220188 RepID=A0A4S3JI98_9EURO|nr:hypothetical protein EYZ11_005397 [Aspergillus tanneri]